MARYSSKPFKLLNFFSKLLRKLHPRAPVVRLVIFKTPSLSCLVVHLKHLLMKVEEGEKVALFHNKVGVEVFYLTYI